MASTRVAPLIRPRVNLKADVEEQAAPAVAPAGRWAQAAAELFGTFGLIYVGVMVLTAGGQALFANGTKDLVAVALAHGLIIAVMVSATMNISGGQLNPAVTIALWSTKRIPSAQAIVNVIAQCAGGVLGGVLAKASLGSANITPGIPGLGGHVSTTQGLVVEAVLTFFLVFVVFGTAVDGRFGAKLGGLAIGATVALDILAGGPITGASMNPARWLGPAIAQGHFATPLIYLTGPVIGGLVAAQVWHHVFLRKTPAAE